VALRERVEAGGRPMAVWISAVGVEPSPVMIAPVSRTCIVAARLSWGWDGQSHNARKPRPWADCPFVAHAATWRALPLRSAAASEQQSMSAPGLALTWPPVRETSTDVVGSSVAGTAHKQQRARRFCIAGTNQ
jgi:hypothetical protein